MIDRIRQLEQQARALEPDAEVRRQQLDRVEAHSKQFLEQINELNAYNESEENGRGLYDWPVTEEPHELDQLLELYEEHVNTPGLNPASGGHLAYIPGGGLYPSALADYLAAVTNRYAGVYFASPGAVRMENQMIRWLCDLVGLPEGTSGGNMASGGSMANLIGIVTARDACNIKAADIPKAVIYGTDHMHHCLDKSFKIAGLEEAVLRRIPMDDYYCMDARALEQQVQKDKADGLRPFLVIGSAGTTNLGAVDPLDDIAETCDDHDLWLHVDAAYGGFFKLCKSGRDKLNGMRHADSLIIDPHKGLFLPYGTGVLLVRNVEHLYNAHHYKAEYMQDTFRATEELSPSDLSPELSKHYRGLRMWLPLMLFGLKPFRAALEEKMQLTRYFYEEVQNIDGIEVGPEPELSVMIFRHVPDKGNADRFNEALTRTIHADGRVFLASTQVDGKTWLRLAVVSFRTHLETIDLALDIIRESIDKVKRDGTYLHSSGCPKRNENAGSL